MMHVARSIGSLPARSSSVSISSMSSSMMMRIRRSKNYNSSSLRIARARDATAGRLNTVVRASSSPVEVKEKPAETKKTKAATKKAEVAAPKRRRKRDMVKSFIKMRILDLILLTVNDEKGINKIAGRFPTKYQTTFIELFDSYRTQLAIKHSGDNEKALKEAVQIFKVLVRAYARQLDNPHEFAST